MAKINFNYEYPYFYYAEKARYGVHQGTSQVTLNGSYTYPIVFNTTVPTCTHIELDLKIENRYGSVFNIDWAFMVYRQNYGWYTVKTFTLPNDGLYSLVTDISDNYPITQFAFVPSYRQSSGYSWTTYVTVKKLFVKESLDVNDVETGMFQYGVFPNYYGVDTDISEVYVNIDGVLKPATNVLVNIDGELVPIAPVYSAHFNSTVPDTMRLYKYIPSESGSYKIKVKHLSGDHEARLYNSRFEKLHDSFFYNSSFDLTANTTYYITLTHYYGRSENSESYLQIYKEE